MWVIIDESYREILEIYVIARIPLDPLCLIFINLGNYLGLMLNDICLYIDLKLLARKNNDVCGNLI